MSSKLIKYFVSTFVLAVSFSSIASARNAIEVCQHIASINSSNGAKCVEVASRGYISDLAADVCYKSASSSTAAGVECLEASVGQNFDPSATKVCEIIAAINSTNSIACLRAAANKMYPNGIAAVCERIAQSSTVEAVKCMANSGTPTNNWPSGQCPSTAEIRRDLTEALQFLERGNSRQGSRQIRQILRRIEGCP